MTTKRDTKATTPSIDRSKRLLVESCVSTLDVLSDTACVRRSECYSWTRYRERVVVFKSVVLLLIPAYACASDREREIKERACIKLSLSLVSSSHRCYRHCHCCCCNREKMNLLKTCVRSALLFFCFLFFPKK